MRTIIKTILAAALLAAPFALNAAHQPENVTSKEEVRTETNLNDDKCKSCRGKGGFTCNMCDGTGWRTCTFCGGEGTVDMGSSRETCASCQGKKGFECGYCDRGWRKCNACDGTGQQHYVGR